MVKRTVGTLLLGLMLLAMFALPALATEGGAEFHEYEDIKAEVSDVGREFLSPDAEERERPGFFDWMIYPLAAAGVAVTGFIVVQYLVFQPRFAREAEERSKR